MKNLYNLMGVALSALCVSCAAPAESTTTTNSSGEYTGKAFPYTVTETTAERYAETMSESTKRVLTGYMGYRPEENPLFTNFKYTPLKGLEYPDDGTLSRRDPSKVVKVGDTYYMWYTKRHTKCAPLGAKNAAKCDDETPSTDWDLADIWYSTSKDGFTWEEQGVAVSRPAKPIAGFRSISTPDILVWKGRYYLYFQAFSEPSGLRGDYCPVTMAHSDSPDGPWTYHEGTVISTGEEGAWNQFAIHDPYPLVHEGRIYIYYKSAFNRPDRLWVGQGLATSDSPEGPFVHHENNPILASGHEFSGFPFKGGLAAILTTDGMERNTIQYSDDWINFRIASIVEYPPVAAAPYCADAYTDTTNGLGIEWGVSHFVGVGKGAKKHSEIVRFDCQLTQEITEPSFQTTRPHATPEVLLKNKLPENIMKKRMNAAQGK